MRRAGLERKRDAAPDLVQRESHRRVETARLAAQPRVLAIAERDERRPVFEIPFVPAADDRRAAERRGLRTTIASWVSVRYRREDPVVIPPPLAAPYCRPVRQRQRRFDVDEVDHVGGR